MTTSNLSKMMYSFLITLITMMSMATLTTAQTKGNMALLNSRQQISKPIKKSKKQINKPIVKPKPVSPKPQPPSSSIVIAEGDFKQNGAPLWLRIEKHKVKDSNGKIIKGIMVRPSNTHKKSFYAPIPNNINKYSNGQGSVIAFTSSKSLQFGNNGKTTYFRWIESGS